MADSYYIPQIEYQSRDYTSIRDDLINLIPNFAPQWTSRDANDFGIVLIELFSYMGDILNYYIDRSANEGFISTATQRETVLNLARLFGYTPVEPVPAQFNVVATSIGTASTTEVKTLAQFSTSASDTNGNYIYFEYLGASPVTIASTVAATTTILLTEGQTVATTQVAVSDGTPDQTYPIYNDSLVYASSVGVTVGGTLSGGVVSGGTTYSKVDNLIDYNSTDVKFSTYYDGNGILNIRFGDGVSGKIPPANSPIFASYRKGQGSKGNVGASTITQVLSNSGGSDLNAYASFSNTTATAVIYGSDPESTDSIRINAPLSLRALNRAVSLSDYASLGVQSSSVVSKANAIADNYNSIILFVMGNNWNNSLDSTALATVKTYFTGKTPPGTALTVLNGALAYPALTLNIVCVPTASNSAVQANVLSALQNYLSFDNVTFNDVIYQSDIYKVVKAVDGVNDVTITGFERRTTSSATVSTTPNSVVYFYVNEVPKWDAQNFTVTTSGGGS